MLRLARSTFGLVVFVSLVLTLATLLIGTIVHDITHEALEEQIDLRISAETASLLGDGSGVSLASLEDAIRKRSEPRTSGQIDYLLVDDQGKILVATIEASPPQRPGYDEYLAFKRGEKSGIAQSVTTKVPGGRLVVAADRSDLQKIDWTITTFFAFALAGMLLIGIGGALLVGLLTRSRLARIDATARGIIGGDLDRRVPVDGSGSEFDRLAVTLNRMLDRISGLMTDLRSVSSDVAHDLRTPLTRLLNRLERALADPRPDVQTQQIEAARMQANELLEIFAALLRIAEVEGLSDAIPRQVVDLSELVEQMAETYGPDLEAHGCRLTCDIASGLRVQADRRLLAQALSNLLENLLRHTPSGTNATITARNAQGTIELLVGDDGPGVAPADRVRLFRRFARGERARSTAGNGLGLALVAAVASAHGGTASLATGPGFGVLMRIPAMPAA